MFLAVRNGANVTEAIVKEEIEENIATVEGG